MHLFHPHQLSFKGKKQRNVIEMRTKCKSLFNLTVHIQFDLVHGSALLFFTSQHSTKAFGTLYIIYSVTFSFDTSLLPAEPPIQYPVPSEILIFETKSTKKFFVLIYFQNYRRFSYTAREIAKLSGCFASKCSATIFRIIAFCHLVARRCRCAYLVNKCLSGFLYASFTDHVNNLEEEIE